jgi:transposase
MNEEDRERIRRLYYVEKQSIHQIARTEGCNRITIRKALSDDPQPSRPPPRQKPKPVFGPYKERVGQLLQENERLPRKQRYTAHRIFEIIRTEGYQGCESTIRMHVARFKQATRAPDVFLPLEYDPGQDAQVDWGEAYAVIAGQRQKVQLFIMRLCFSRRTFAMAFPTQRQESFFYGHVKAFEHFGGVPHRISYDNLGTAVKLVFEHTGRAGRPRKEVRAFVSFRSHYLFESHFCTPGQGHEKGQVEHGGGYSRRNFLVPIPEAASFEELNQQLLDRCLQEDQRQVARQQMTIGDAWKQEHEHFLPVPRSSYECCHMTTVRVTPYSQATFETNRYSIPVKRARREVTLKAYPFTIEIWDGTELLAHHPRCYGRHHDILDPLHYLPLLEQRPGAFDFTKPMRQWRRNGPAAYDEMLADLRQKWPNGRGVQEFVKILELHQTYSPEVMRQAIEQALQLRCVHLDGVLYCIREIERKGQTSPADPPHNLDLSHRPDLDAVGKNQRVNLAHYDKLLKQSWEEGNCCYANHIPQGAGPASPARKLSPSSRSGSVPGKLSSLRQGCHAFWFAL